MMANWNKQDVFRDITNMWMTQKKVILCIEHKARELLKNRCHHLLQMPLTECSFTSTLHIPRCDIGAHLYSVAPAWTANSIPRLGQRSTTEYCFPDWLSRL